MIINLSSLSGLFVGYRSDYNRGFAAVTPQWSQIATLIPSATGTNEYPFEGTMPKFREWIGDRHVKNIRVYTYSLENKEFELTVSVPRKYIINDQYGVFRPKMEQMGYSAGMHPDEIVFGAAAAGATDLCYDGQPFFNGSHPIIVDGVATTTSNYDNNVAGNLWFLADTTKPMKPFIYQKREPYTFVSHTKPDSDNVFWRNEYVYGGHGHGAAGYGLWQLAYGSINTLNATNVDTYYDAMTSLKDDNGHPLGIKPNLLVVGPSNRAAARDLIKKEYLATGESNIHYGEFDILLSPFLS